MQSNYQIIIYPLAKLDLEEIYRYISDILCNNEAAIRLIDKFDDAFKRISLFPESCPLINNKYIKDKTLRKLVVESFITFYRINNNAIEIVRILYAKRNYRDIF